jgi:hypothetical protein
MNLDGIRFPCLASVAVTVEGRWSLLPRRDWRGVAVADEPLVAVAFLSCGGSVHWYKSERRGGDRVEVRCLLLPFAAGEADTQVNFSVGQGGGRCWSMLASPEGVPVIPDRRELRSGVIERFAEVAGEPRVGLSLLLIARRDVRSARNGLWRVRRGLADLIPEPFRRTLTYGRAGMLGEGIGDAQAEVGGAEVRSSEFK